MLLLLPLSLQPKLKIEKKLPMLKSDVFSPDDVRQIFENRDNRRIFDVLQDGDENP